MYPNVSRVREVVALVRTQQLPFLAAAIAYYAFISVVPLLIVTLVATTAVAGDALAAELVDSLDGLLTPETADLLESTLVEPSGRGGVTAVGAVVLLWGALRVFRGLDVAFSAVYGVSLDKPLPEQVADALLVLGAVGLAVTATVLGGAFLSLSPVGVRAVSGPLTLAVVLPLVFFPFYYVFPARDVTFREAVPGALVAGLGWTGLGAVFGLYASRAGSFQLYGVLGGVLLLLVWFYFAGLVLLVGAAVNAVLAGRLEDRQLQHDRPRRGNQRATMGDDRSVERQDRTGGENGDTATTHQSDNGSGRGRQRCRDDTDGDQRTDEVVTESELEALRERVEGFESEIEDRTVHRDELERDLEQYVRRRVRRGHARDWGPYLVLLYGTVMTLGAFVFLGGGWAILAMLVIWLSTLGLYALMVIVGVTAGALALPGRIADRLRSLRNLR